MSGEKKLIQSLELATLLQTSLKEMVSDPKEIQEDYLKIKSNKLISPSQTRRKYNEQNDYHSREPSICSCNPCNQSCKCCLSLKELKLNSAATQKHNQSLIEEVMRIKIEEQTLREELQKVKKYARFLKARNSQLRAEMVIWMRKPVKLEEEQIVQKKNPLQNYLTHQKIKERGDQFNILNYLPVQQKIKNNKNIFDNTHTNQKQTQDQRQFLSTKNKNKIKKYSKKNKQSFKQHSKSLVVNNCTSCNYLNLVNSKNKKNHFNLGSITSTYQTQKYKQNLCQCHRSYLLNTSFVK